MKFAVSSHEVLESFGLTGVVYFPRSDSADNLLDDRTTLFLSQVGLPHTRWFTSKASLSQGESVSLAEWFRPEDGVLPEECSGWLVLAHFAASLLALDPKSGKVYAFGEGDPLESYTELHRHVESLVYSLHLFQQFLKQERGDDDELEARVDHLRSRISKFDAAPFNDGNSQWSLVLEEVFDGTW
ncbi:SUKH-4 family immunity protein [Streptomyces sp. NBC_00557]|uniref:SUKH-4 family immunity protein n=1 Tax=Streptomyces sp. NBC_00557 TaxID=2975776 RepID=UPI002E82231C|nr:SUKH-4 family immunity protein [Streptomyces sp. NBC_00557]WUC35471.1 SUKH-4 family immunity protein [Streptomyces sp. NBC_00557]